ncbi:OmpA family protein [Castellaniella hirudinis]|uniref:OmpA family protein n=1 Tax=Castellaniella hirudinis TaxID=1144617 RepID=UPI0039C1452F
MRSGPVELQPAREFIQRMHALEAELQQARQQQRRLRADPGAAARWGLESGPAPQQEEGWFLTYLDMMTLLLVVMIVMLSFSGPLIHVADDAGAPPPAAPVQAAALPGASSPAAPGQTVPSQTVPSQAALVALAPPEGPFMAQGDAPRPMAIIPAPDSFAPYPAAPTGDFYPLADSANRLARLSSAYPTPGDLTPPAAPALPSPAAAPASPSPAADQGAPGAGSPAGSPPAPRAEAAPATPAAQTSPPSGSGDPGGAPAVPAAPAALPAAPSPAPEPPAPSPQSEGQALAADLALDKLGSEVEVVVNQRSISLRINSEILFGTGQADLSPHGQDVLTRMARLLVSKGYDIVVEGHTDSIPVRGNGRYPSNWELSTDRAGSVVRFLLANGIDKAHLRAVGFADTRPIASNQDARGRARNRRVELVIEKGPATASPARPGALVAPPAAAPAAAGQDTAAVPPSETDLILQQAHDRPAGLDGDTNSPTE